MYTQWLWRFVKVKTGTAAEVQLRPAQRTCCNGCFTLLVIKVCRHSDDGLGDCCCPGVLCCIFQQLLHHTGRHFFGVQVAWLHVGAHNDCVAVRVLGCLGRAGRQGCGAV